MSYSAVLNPELTLSSLQHEVIEAVKGRFVFWQRRTESFKRHMTSKLALHPKVGEVQKEEILMLRNTKLKQLPISKARNLQKQ